MADNTDKPTIDLEQYRGRKGAIGVGDGAAERWRALHTQFGGNAARAAEFLSYTSGEQIRRKWSLLGLSSTGAGKRIFHGGLPDHTATPTPSDPVADSVYALLRRAMTRPYSVMQLADKLDVAPKRITAAVEALIERGYHVTIGADDVSLINTPVVMVEPMRTGWADHKLRFGVVSDTHIESRFSCLEELHGAYDFFASEGIDTVLVPGDLHDGPGERGYQGHRQEVRDGCQIARDCVRFSHDNYPRREGIRTVFIESGKSHAGWEFAASGFNMGRNLAEGFVYESPDPDGASTVYVPPREDLIYRGHDQATLTAGPEDNTRIDLYHPDGGSAYAWSYQLQKWAESVEGGNKPHLALFGHYHKLCTIRIRNIHIVSCETMCWQTPYMLRKRLEAHVGFLLLEMTVDTDGTIRSFNPNTFPFFLHERRVFDMGKAA